ncbi:ABC transporter ATP-binding protein [Bradyrhizobium sp. 38]|uniref:ABC transporter ATP-binding protein n=1 Tax=unclassified Bradyrhizobium TaxID=2631580 RepID=UPI001FFC28F0|nr:MULTISPECIES: ABC transporter ATP-binding protein [unclassified Bradyrhizobium]MCK1337952.1 ABC transporter ATP-binding protein [Bradyrhizobium sp. 38]MCK1780408.1 ABC transporter ATP-binding protein [Bradyrhizobium sp. 132]
MSASLSLRTVDKVYHPRGRLAVHAVKALSMDVERGEIVALLGSSGCGKTSTLRMVAGFEAVSAGEISLANRRIERLAPAARNVAMAFEGYSLYPPLTVRENIAFALKRGRLSASEVSRRVKEVAALVEIEPILDRYPNAISGGQQQRASLARALVRDAALYVLDEPMGQLEPQLRALLRGRLKRLLKDRAMTSIFVTHDQTEANALADRIAVMEGGVLQQFAPQHVLKEKPANLYVATFIGEPPMNVFDASVIRSEGCTTFELHNGPSFGFGDNELGPEVRQAIGNRRKVVIGVRPHRVVLGSGSAETARVVSNQWLGDQSHVAMAVAGKLLVAVSHARVRAGIGDSVPYGVRAQDLHIFDPDTTVALAHGARAA